MSRSRGFAMVDVLVALVLLAVTMTGACTTIFHSLRATHRAQLATHAADLAADLIEQTRGLPPGADVTAILAQWRDRVAVILPVAGMQPGEYASLTPRPASSAHLPPIADLRLRWHEDSRTVRELHLPVPWTGGTGP